MEYGGLSPTFCSVHGCLSQTLISKTQLQGGLGWPGVAWEWGQTCFIISSGLWSLIGTALFLVGDTAECNLHAAFEGLCYCQLRLPQLVSHDCDILSTWNNTITILLNWTLQANRSNTKFEVNLISHYAHYLQVVCTYIQTWFLNFMKSALLYISKSLRTMVIKTKLLVWTLNYKTTLFTITQNYGERILAQLIGGVVMIGIAAVGTFLTYGLLYIIPVQPFVSVFERYV